MGKKTINFNELTDNIVEIDIEGFLVLVRSSILFSRYTNENSIEKIVFQDNGYLSYKLLNGEVNVITNDDKDFYTNLFKNSNGYDDILVECIKLILDNINIGNIHKIKYKKTIEIPKTLYKYTSNKSQHLDLLFKSQISFVHKKTFNDIYDCGIESFCHFSELTDNMRVLCLSNNEDIEAMWGLYANSYKGFCFSYPLENIYKCIREKIDKRNLVFALHGDIEYVKSVNNYNQSINQTVKNHNLLQEVIKRCFIKDESWSFEKEHRIICFGQFDNKDFPLSNLKPSSYCFYSYLDNDVVDKAGKKRMETARLNKA